MKLNDGVYVVKGTVPRTSTDMLPQNQLFLVENNGTIIKYIDERFSTYYDLSTSFSPNYFSLNYNTTEKSYKADILPNEASPVFEKITPISNKQFTLHYVDDKTKTEGYFYYGSKDSLAGRVAIFADTLSVYSIHIGWAHLDWIKVQAVGLPPATSWNDLKMAFSGFESRYSPWGPEWAYENGLFDLGSNEIYNLADAIANLMLSNIKSIPLLSRDTGFYEPNTHYDGYKGFEGYTQVTSNEFSYFNFSSILKANYEQYKKTRNELNKKIDKFLSIDDKYIEIDVNNYYHIRSNGELDYIDKNNNREYNEETDVTLPVSDSDYLIQNLEPNLNNGDEYVLLIRKDKISESLTNNIEERILKIDGVHDLKQVLFINSVQVIDII